MITTEIKRYVDLTLTIGLNLKAGDLLNVKLPTHLDWLAVEIANQAYAKGVKNIFFDYVNEEVARINFDNQSDETLSTVYDFQIEKDRLQAEDNFKFLTIASPNPYAMKGVDASKVQLQMSSFLEKCFRVKENAMSNKNSWCVIAAANQKWADYAVGGDVDKLWEMIFKAMRVDSQDYIQQWNEHIAKLSVAASKLNDYQFDKLVFTNELGTNLTVGLVKNHLWAAAGDENTRTGEYFVANLPTEEVFTMPHKYQVNGKVIASKPLNNNGQIIDEFWLEFTDGKVSDYDAKNGKDSLKSIITTDNGSAYIGEVALVSKNSPINLMNQLFYNTLFDENSSCHLALGAAYPTNIVGGSEMSPEMKEENGVNTSKEHVDFMFGTPDMKIVGYGNGNEVVIFENGDFII